MAIDLQKILERLDSLEREVSELKQSPTGFENLAPDAVVGKDYVAWKFGVSIHAILNGNLRTNKIPRYSKRPLKFIKADVDRVFNETAKKPVKERAHEEIKKAKPRRYSVIKKVTA